LLQRAVDCLAVWPQVGPQVHEIAGCGEHDAVDSSFDEEVWGLPAVDLIDCDWDGGIEQEVGVERDDGGSVDAACAAESLDELGLVDLVTDGFDVWVGV
jgi:hypothetical protein